MIGPLPPRKPGKQVGSRRESRRQNTTGPYVASRAIGVGPENLPRGLYTVEVIYYCRFDGTEMGRAVRHTPPDMGGETETRSLSSTEPGMVFDPRKAEDGFEKWWFQCTKCPHNVLVADEAIEAELDKLFAPWARRVVRVRC